MGVFIAQQTTICLARERVISDQYIKYIWPNCLSIWVFFCWFAFEQGFGSTASQIYRDPDVHFRAFHKSGFTTCELPHQAFGGLLYHVISYVLCGPHSSALDPMPVWCKLAASDLPALQADAVGGHFCILATIWGPALEFGRIWYYMLFLFLLLLPTDRRAFNIIIIFPQYCRSSSLK